MAPAVPDRRGAGDRLARRTNPKRQRGPRAQPAAFDDRAGSPLRESPSLTLRVGTRSPAYNPAPFPPEPNRDRLPQSRRRPAVLPVLRGPGADAVRTARRQRHRRARRVARSRPRRRRQPGLHPVRSEANREGAVRAGPRAEARRVSVRQDRGDRPADGRRRGYPAVGPAGPDHEGRLRLPPERPRQGRPAQGANRLLPEAPGAPRRPRRRRRLRGVRQRAVRGGRAAVRHAAPRTTGRVGEERKDRPGPDRVLRHAPGPVRDGRGRRPPAVEDLRRDGRVPHRHRRPDERLPPVEARGRPGGTGSGEAEVGVRPRRERASR